MLVGDAETLAEKVISMKLCPNCKKQQADDATECNHCGIIFEKYQRVIDKKNNDAEELYKQGRLQEAQEAFQKLFLEYPDQKAKIKIFLEKINRENFNEKLLSEANNEFVLRNYKVALNKLSQIKTELQNIKEKRDDLQDRIKKIIENNKDSNTKENISTSVTPKINKNLFMVVTPISLFIILMFVGFLFFKTEQKIIFVAKKISYKKDTGSFSCQLKCSIYTKSLDEYLSNGWELVSSAQKSIIAEDFHV